MNLVGAGVFVFHENRFLLGFRREGVWGLPGGKIEPKEKELDTMIRELKEETNLSIISPSSVQRLGTIEWEYKNIKGNSAIYKTDSSNVTGLLVDNGEFTEFKWVCIEDASKLDLFGPTKKSLELLKNKV